MLTTVFGFMAGVIAFIIINAYQEDNGDDS
jgi:hypothetical protein